MSYLDIDTILCDEERLPCHFLLEASDLGFLDSTIESPDLPEGSRVELPMWMALVLSDKQMASLELPKHFERKMRDEILAGAANINLKEYSFYFFEVGSRLATQLDSRDLKEIMFKAFSGERYRELMV